MRTAVGQSVFHNKYAHEGCETWEKLSSTLVDEVCGDLLSKEEVDEITKLHSEMKFIAGGRYLYYAGRDMKFYNNCFSGDTKVITDKGLQKLKDIEGQTVNLLSPVSGKFLPAKINNHGKQKLRELTFKSIKGKSNLTYKIKATRNHHWALINGKDTYDLRLNDVVPSNAFSCEEDKIGYLHGLIFGDGSLEYTVKKGEFKYVNKIRLCNKKSLLLDDILEILKSNGINYTLSYPESYKNDPLIRIWYSYSFKNLPLDNDSSAYKAGFIRGWLATDGSETAGGKLASINENYIDWFIENACLAGVVITGNKRYQIRDTEYKNNHQIFIITYSYGKKFGGFKLIDIKELGEEDVFCPFEPIYNRIVIEHNIDTFNCFIFKSTEDSREDWANLSWKAQTCLMTGGGIGNDYSIYREKGAPIGRTGGVSSGPISQMLVTNEIGRNVMQGGSRRCLKEDSSVTMANSTRKQIKDVRVGDLVQTRFGAKKVIAVADQGIQDLIKIETEHGEVICTSNHRWLAADSNRNKKWINAENLKVGNKLYYHPFSYEGSIDYDIEEAYVLGFYMANGCAYHSNRTHEVTFQVDKKYYSEDFMNLLKRVMGQYCNPTERNGHGECIELRCRNKDLVDKFQSYKKPHEKPNIPNVLDWNLDARYAFLSGWFDADGCYSDSWKLSNSHPDTLKELKEICLTVGLHTTINGNELRFSDYQRNHFINTIGKYSFKLKVKEKDTKFKIHKETNEIPSKILSISKVKEFSTFDIEVEEVNEFIADDFVSHNSAIYASLNWKHPDAHEMLLVKDWKKQHVPGTGMTYKDLKEKDFNFPAPLDMTNISLNYDNKFLDAIHGEDESFIIYRNKEIVTKDLQLPSMFLNNVQKACENGEPGFSFNFFDKEDETGRNACQPAFAKILTKAGIKRFDEVDVGTEIWSTEGWTKIVKKWSTGIKKVYEVIFSDDRSKFIGTLNHKLVTGIDYKDDSPIKRELQEIILDRLPVKTFSYDSNSILMRDSEGLIAGRFTEENYTKNHKLLGEHEVWEITVDNISHTYWTEGVNASNCTEVTSADDSDVCNLGSINMAEIETIEEFCLAVEMGIKFLFCGTLKADLPYDKVYQIREKNRRLGLGLMGIHEWLLKRGYRYEVTEELHKWLHVYKVVSDRVSLEMATRLSVSRPVANRAIAPTGSIGMLAGTTTGIEPLYAVAFKRRYLKEGHNWHYQYVIDGTAKMLINEYGLDPEKIETAIDLAADPERRIKFQADIQDYVDMSISSTINLPAWGSELNNESTYPKLAQILGRYAHRLRGFTCYPDGARGGQPLTSVSYHDAIQHEGNEYVEEYNDVCVLTGKGGTCGS